MNTSDAHTITVGGDPITPNPTAALLWLDVETTGLDPNTCSILEIGAICTSLANITDWSWWIVLLPIWGPAAYVALTLAFCTIGLLAATILDHFDHLDHTNTKDNQ